MANDDAAPNTSSLEERLSAARERAAKRDEARERERLERDVERLELEERLESECGGPRGQAFDLHETTQGIIAIGLGPGVLHKRFRESKMRESDVHDFVTPCVIYPEKEKFLAIVAKCPGALVDVANKLVDLYAARTEDAAGKR